MSVSYYCIDFIECERYEHCLRCDYDYQYAYGSEQYVVGNRIIRQMWSDTDLKKLQTQRKLNRALFIARRNFRKRHGKYRKGGAR